MRKIKFKAYLKRNKQMVDVKSIHFGTRKIIVGYSKSKTDYGNYSVSFDDIELMQYTGLKDKNEVEIYEGDILLAPAWFGELKCVCIYQQDNIVSSIQGFGLYSYDSYYNDYRTLVGSDEWDEFEVIGNIYDNPELLEKE